MLQKPLTRQNQIFNVCQFLNEDPTGSRQLINKTRHEPQKKKKRKKNETEITNQVYRDYQLFVFSIRIYILFKKKNI